MPEWKREIRRRLSHLNVSPTREAEIAEELALHLEDRYEELRSTGASEAEASRVALSEAISEEFTAELRRIERRGPPERPVSGSNRRTNIMWGVWQDLRYAARTLRKRAGFTAVATLTLALGIGACTAIFSVVDAVLLRPLPYPEPDRVVQVREVDEKGSRTTFTEPNFLDVRVRNRTLQAVAQYNSGLVTVNGASEPVRAHACRASGGFFRVLGTQALVGRTFADEESRIGGDGVVVVSYGFWRRLLGGRADLTGTRLRIDDHTLTVIGVMPPNFNFPEETDVWIPREMYPPQLGRRGHNWSVIARLSPGVTLDQARSDISGIARQLKLEYGEETNASDIALIPLHEYMAGDSRKGLLIISAAVAFLMLIAFANVANLLMAQVTRRASEFAVRIAVGATRSRLAQQFITENLLLTLIASLLGMLFSFWGINLLSAINQGNLPQVNQISVNTRTMIFTLGLSLLVTVILGLLPAMRSRSWDLHGMLKEAGRSQQAHSASRRMRGLLVTAQLALTLVLLTGAGLLSRSFYRLNQVEPGFRTESTVVMSVSLPRLPPEEQQQRKLFRVFQQLLEGKRIDEPIPQPSSEFRARQEQQRLFYQQLIEGLSQLPGVVAVGGVNSPPMSGGGAHGPFLIDNSPANKAEADYRLATPGYFAAMGMPLLRGRAFEQNDKPDTPHVAVISQSLAQKYWPTEYPLGRTIQFGGVDGDLRLLHIVGVVGDVRDDGLDAVVRPMVYADVLQRPYTSSLGVVVRAQMDPTTLIPAMRRTVQTLNPDLPASFRTLEDIFSSSLNEHRFSLVIFVAFAVVALLIAITGTYGLMAYLVEQRTQEIGVRMALGATASNVLRLMLGQGFRLILLGLVCGLIASIAVTRVMRSLLFEVTPIDAMTFAAVPIGLTLVALLACYIPARRATKVDPLVALRQD